MRPFWNWNYGHALGAPKGWTVEKDGVCDALPTVRDHEQNEWLSIWETTWRERLALLTGSKVYLTVHGSGHPPVMLTVNRPPPRVL